tara:strand:+ start:1014 stop:1667 length:654 start_codon:yes stop_codon:yes gene_type:complete
MALVNHDSREIQFKIVYCGAPECGKTTNLHYIFRQLDPRWRGDMVTVATEQNRTISFDFLPVHSTRIAGYETKFQLYTVPGQDVMRETRKSVLAGVDGIVFVADSSPGRFEPSVRSYHDCRQELSEIAIDPRRIPIAFQFNKRDAHRATPPVAFDEAFNVSSPSFLSCAVSGYQVFATLDWLTQRVLKGFHASNTRRSESRIGVEGKLSPASLEPSY